MQISKHLKALIGRDNQQLHLFSEVLPGIIKRTGPCGRKYKWCEGGMFDLFYSLFLGPLFDPFMLSVCGGELGMSVGRGQGVKYSNVKVSSFKCSSPKTVGCYI